MPGAFIFRHNYAAADLIGVTCLAFVAKLATMSAHARIIARRSSMVTEKPGAYPVPTDGPVASMLAAGGRHGFCPTHLHFMVKAAGCEPLVTPVFVDGDPYLDCDGAFTTSRNLAHALIWMMFLLPMLSYADCPSLIIQLNTALHYQQDESVEYLADCKIWPADPRKTLVALAHYQTNSSMSSPASHDGLYDLDVVIVETASGEILQRILQKGALDSDALYLKSITIDTGRYLLAPTVRAFGVRAMRGNPHADYETLSLYVARNNELTSVMQNLVTYKLFGEPQGPGGCARSSETKRKLAMAKTSHHGLADVLVLETGLEQDQTVVKDGCEIDEHKSAQHYELHFDGASYVLPALLQQ